MSAQPPDPLPDSDNSRRHTIPLHQIGEDIRSNVVLRLNGNPESDVGTISPNATVPPIVLMRPHVHIDLGRTARPRIMIDIHVAVDSQAGIDEEDEDTYENFTIEWHPGVQRGSIDDTLCWQIENLNAGIVADHRAEWADTGVLLDESKLSRRRQSRFWRENGSSLQDIFMVRFTGTRAIKEWDSVSSLEENLERIPVGSVERQMLHALLEEERVDITILMRHTIESSYNNIETMVREFEWFRKAYDLRLKAMHPYYNADGTINIDLSMVPCDRFHNRAFAVWAPDKQQIADACRTRGAPAEEYPPVLDIKQIESPTQFVNFSEYQVFLSLAMVRSEQFMQEEQTQIAQHTINEKLKAIQQFCNNLPEKLGDLAYRWAFGFCAGLSEEKNLTSGPDNYENENAPIIALWKDGERVLKSLYSSTVYGGIRLSDQQKSLIFDAPKHVTGGIMLTRGGPRCGKTVTHVLLAMMLMLAGHRILLLARPTSSVTVFMRELEKHRTQIIDLIENEIASGGIDNEKRDSYRRVKDALIAQKHIRFASGELDELLKQVEIEERTVSMASLVACEPGAPYLKAMEALKPTIIFHENANTTHVSDAIYGVVQESVLASVVFGDEKSFGVDSGEDDMVTEIYEFQTTSSLDTLMKADFSSHYLNKCFTAFPGFNSINQVLYDSALELYNE